MEAANDNDLWSGIRLYALSSSATQAKAEGEKIYFTGKPCKNGHSSPRFLSGACIECAMERGLVNSWIGTYSGGKTRAKIVRLIAKRLGEDKYVPHRPCINGHLLRWTGTNNCVLCDKEKRSERKDKVKDAAFRKKYGMSLADRDSMVEDQGNVCLICQEILDLQFNTHIDHCHTSGRVRGVLCSKCNQGIGLFRDNPEFMRRAANYVEDHSDDLAA